MIDSIHPEAEAEYAEAAAYYKVRSADASISFLGAVEHTLALIQRYPAAGTPEGGSVRRSLVPGFPFSIVYRYESGKLDILAIAHARRHPGYWRGRIDTLD